MYFASTILLTLKFCIGICISFFVLVLGHCLFYFQPRPCLDNNKLFCIISVLMSRSQWWTLCFPLSGTIDSIQNLKFRNTQALDFGERHSVTTIYHSWYDVWRCKEDGLDHHYSFIQIHITNNYIYAILLICDIMDLIFLLSGFYTIIYFYSSLMWMQWSCDIYHVLVILQCYYIMPGIMKLILVHRFSVK